MTLIKSNPEFKAQRSKFFCDNFNKSQKSLEEVNLIFRRIDLLCNAINEKTGKNIDAEEMYLMVISAINDDSYSLSDIDCTGLYDEMDQIFFRYLPTLYSSDTLPTLNKLRNIPRDVTISILSNTGFVKARTLKIALERIGLSEYFDFQLYSDEIGLSKPNLHLFNLMIENVREVRKEFTITQEILHIGDNPNADIFGACNAGLKSLLINSNDKTILNILN